MIIRIVIIRIIIDPIIIIRAVLQDIHRSGGVSHNGLDCLVQRVDIQILDKGVSRSCGNNAKRGQVLRWVSGQESVDQVKIGAVPAHGHNGVIGGNIQVSSNALDMIPEP